MENNKNKKSVKFQGDMLNFCDFIEVFVFTRNHHLNNLFGRHDILSAQLIIPEFRTGKIIVSLVLMGRPSSYSDIIFHSEHRSANCVIHGIGRACSN